jgi:methyl-accepting chemotaxis protein
MLPHKFTGNVTQRMSLWAGILAYLVLLYAATEVIHNRRLAEFSRDFAAIAAASSELTALEPLLAHLPDDAAGRPASANAADLQRLDAPIERILQSATGEVRNRAAEFRTIATQLEAGAIAPGQQLHLLNEAKSQVAKAVLNDMEGMRARQDGHFAAASRNKVLLALLTALVIGQVLVLEYKWLIKPIGAMAAALKATQRNEPLLKAYAMRRDEIGALGQALHQFVALTDQQQRAARETVSALSRQVEQQERQHMGSLAFQQQIASIVQALEGNAERMATASATIERLSRVVD